MDSEDGRCDTKSGVPIRKFGTPNLFDPRRKNGMHVARSGPSVLPGGT